MDDKRPAQSPLGNNNKPIYKDAHQRYRSPNPPTRSAAFVAIGIMVSAWLIFKALVAFAPLTSSAPVNSSLPLLLDATAEELTLGLENGQFTSVDLVQVSHKRGSSYMRRLVANVTPGLRCTYP
jgi:hypothetical protein